MELHDSPCVRLAQIARCEVPIRRIPNAVRHQERPTAESQRMLKGNTSEIK
jgi:hypothetical protein